MCILIVLQVLLVHYTDEDKIISRVIWITGLSGSGKTTLGIKISSVLKDKGSPVVYLDGDQLREVFGVDAYTKKNYNKDFRFLLAMKYAHLCRVLAEQNITVVISTISMFSEVYKWNRQNLPNYFEIYLKVPITELRNRDPKGIYHSYYSGKLRHVFGLDIEVDEPKSPDLLFDFIKKKYTADEMTVQILDKV